MENHQRKPLPKATRSGRAPDAAPSRTTRAGLFHERTIHEIRHRAGLLASGSRFHLPFPRSLDSQWIQRQSSPVTAAGPQRIYTVFPILLTRQRAVETPRSFATAGDPGSSGVDPTASKVDVNQEV